MADYGRLERGEAPVVKQELKILCFNLTKRSRSVQLVLCSAAVFVFYLLYGYMQELIFRLPGFRPFGWYLTLYQFLIYSLFAFGESKAAGGRARKIPLKVYVQLATLTVATMGLSNASVGFLNYPTQVIFKCCKLIPVLIGGVLIQGKRFSCFDLCAAALMSIGLILFTLADSEVSPIFDARGYVMICGALVADAIIGNVQEKAMKSHGASNSEVVLYSYSIGSIFLFLGTLVSGELQDAFQFCIENPKETYGYGLIFSVSGYLGINVVLSLVKTFGAFVAVTITTCRKAVTILLSFVLFTKAFSMQYVWSGFIVVLGIYLNVYGKNRDKLPLRLVFGRIVSFFWRPNQNLPSITKVI